MTINTFNKTKKTSSINATKTNKNAKESKTSGEQYFSTNPNSLDLRRTLQVDLRGKEVSVQVSNGVFSSSKLDLGTAVLLKHAPQPPENGRFFDIGCGWGAISLALGFESPNAQIYAVDVNERALELTNINAKNAGLNNIHTYLVEDALKEDSSKNIDLIWSNPPIRVGKDVLHNILLTWLPRLKVGGAAYLVVQKNLGSDSLIPWLSKNLGEDFSVEKYASSKGYRIIEVLRK
ncbi:class I SAM-dependent methyltransferase [Gardnerella pickettii]|uniref:Methyltransferase domain-containing protein n=2 Tax=Gardnerella TaxID=2701 RepID=A0ABX4SHN8_9BIFI|nr:MULTISPECIES: methyltransferase [Gardnerella]EPI47469.1 methyltransferase small domain protein [Gardnerella vaginalis JCP8151B]MDK7784712.1 methyltransferase [Bifidobacterium sp. UMB6791B]MDK8248353.1 methyltransferase [Bifidobacterium sp. UMB6794B]MDK8635527.1 methyltransferase [Bifidobacterium sp. UMB6791A]PKZ53071.1 methyltransferase domain-containing protein [Gardnerella pickettii]